MIIEKRTQFAKNYAETNGGGVNNDVLEAFYSDDTIFIDNKAKQYGDNIGAFA